MAEKGQAVAPFLAAPANSAGGSDTSDTSDTSEIPATAAGLLVVEDDFLIAMQAETALSDAGFRVLGVATTAEEAVSLARAQLPALVLMDIRLAGRRDGIDAAGDLFRELGVRCVFATAHDDPLTRKRADPFEPLGWLAKPYTMTSLVNLVRDALDRVS